MQKPCHNDDAKKLGFIRGMNAIDNKIPRNGISQNKLKSSADK